MATKPKHPQPAPTAADHEPDKLDLSGRLDEMVDALLGPPLREPVSATQRPAEDEPPR